MSQPGQMPRWHEMAECKPTDYFSLRLVACLHFSDKSKLWRNLTAEGTIVARTADIGTAEEQATVRRFVAEAAGGGVWVIDDGDHFSTPLLVHFHLLARYVTANGYYVVADTRLDRTCRSAMRRHVGTRYCSMILHAEGGPGRAVHYLQRHHPLLLSGRFTVDRQAERWILTQHPGMLPTVEAILSLTSGYGSVFRREER